MLYSLLKRNLFAYEPEDAHHKAFHLLNILTSLPFGKTLLKKMYSVQDATLQKNVFGLTFSNPVGIAAGFDKNAEWINLFPLLGFGFAEVGTVTPRPQEGNPKPRLFRLTKDYALLNRMGFNNKGVQYLKQQLQKRTVENFVIGINIGKNKDTPNELAYQDYCYCLEHLFHEGNYFVMNISSPNTPNLRQLQQKQALTALIEPVQNLNIRMGKKPLLIKIAPDLMLEELDTLLETAVQFEISGIVATNTTINKEGLKSYLPELGEGGISGKPLQPQANKILQHIKQKHPQLPVIAVGGIMNSQDAMEKFQLGAELVQIYTGYIYYGPSLPKNINHAVKNE